MQPADMRKLQFLILLIFSFQFKFHHITKNIFRGFFFSELILYLRYNFQSNLFDHLKYTLFG